MTVGWEVLKEDVPILTHPPCFEISLLMTVTVFQKSVLLHVGDETGQDNYAFCPRDYFVTISGF